MDSLRANLDEIVRLCRLYEVSRLTAFGSIVREDFDSSRSDADFMVEFKSSAARVQNYLGLQRGLAALLSRPVDLVEEGAIRNPYILRNIARQQQVLYAA